MVVTTAGVSVFGSPVGGCVITDVTSVTTVVGVGLGVVVGATYVVEGSAEIIDVEGGNVVVEGIGVVVDGAADDVADEVEGVVVAAVVEGVVAVAVPAVVVWTACLLGSASCRRSVESIYLTTWRSPRPVGQSTAIRGFPPALAEPRRAAWNSRS